MSQNTNMYDFTRYFLLITALVFANGDVQNPEEYDLIVIGGGSGGLAAARVAFKEHNARVLVVDYVAPSPMKSFWREGGTCVNVGCIPKKLMHQAALLGQAIKDASHYGWEINKPEEVKLNWKKMVRAVQDHVQGTSDLTRNQLTGDKETIVTQYLNGLGEFVDAKTVKVTLVKKKSKTGELSTNTKIVKGKYILIAVGGRPKYPEIPGALQYAITSDDLFSLSNPPGKTLIIGGGYIAMESAGFLNGMGFDVTVIVRNKVLKDMDKIMVAKMVRDLRSRNVKILLNTKATSIVEKKGWSWFLGKRLKRCVTWKTRSMEEEVDCFDTVMVASGRTPQTAQLKLENAGVDKTEDGHIDVKEGDKTNVEDIYAIGDVLYNKPELTPVAIKAGQLLVRRLFGNSKVQMVYENVPTTVFTPLEYSFVGKTENSAKNAYSGTAYTIEVIVKTPKKQSGKEKQVKEDQQGKVEQQEQQGKEVQQELHREQEIEGEILGMHILGPSAGEVMQGFAAALRAGLTFKQLQETVGIHPTVAEEFTRVFITKSSKISPIPPSCCS
ncbi:thioredoxin reductase 1, mitochondrial-like isoform X2 [Macrosteles quadrilineatus]|uniref:thioredoxin reductase 1, mitochondrial-like isoform X2 n=1 Tax=Macrosteles quadrilineatus TaxID=74068 RepID=UPI0023E139BA|nr:thioredoxin reductase 1, mitochondrial-like isoform X2 [Macrosteles quadrilineatus]